MFDAEAFGRSVGCRDVAEVMGVLAGEVRIEFLRMLAQRPRAVWELAAPLGLRQSHVSQNLGILREHGFVVCDNHKRERIYRLSDAVEATIEGGVVYLKVMSRDGDFVLLRSRIPFSEAPTQSYFWRWAAESSVQSRNGGETNA